MTGGAPNAGENVITYDPMNVLCTVNPVIIHPEVMLPSEFIVPNTTRWVNDENAIPEGPLIELTLVAVITLVAASITNTPLELLNPAYTCFPSGATASSGMLERPPAAPGETEATTVLVAVSIVYT